LTAKLITVYPLFGNGSLAVDKQPALTESIINPHKKFVAPGWVETKGVEMRSASVEKSAKTVSVENALSIENGLSKMDVTRTANVFRAQPHADTRPPANSPHWPVIRV
jgi:hypothetical protein